jgi:hypothetical protein
MSDTNASTSRVAKRDVSYTCTQLVWSHKGKTDNEHRVWRSRASSLTESYIEFDGVVHWVWRSRTSSLTESYIEFDGVVHRVRWSRTSSLTKSYIEFDGVVHGVWRSREEQKWMQSGTHTYRKFSEVNPPIWVGIGPVSLLADKFL